MASLVIAYAEGASFIATFVSAPLPEGVPQDRLTALVAPDVKGLENVKTQLAIGPPETVTVYIPLDTETEPCTPVAIPKW